MLGEGDVTRPLPSHGANSQQRRTLELQTRGRGAGRTLRWPSICVQKFDCIRVQNSLAVLTSLIAPLAAALEAVKKACAVGKSVAELCELGDSVINEKLQTVYKGKKIEKGIAFPTCISVRAR